MNGGEVDFRGYDRASLDTLRGVLDDVVQALDRGWKDLWSWSGRDVPRWERNLRAYGAEKTGDALRTVADARQDLPDVRQRFMDLWSTVDTVIGIIDRLTEESWRLRHRAAPGSDLVLGRKLDRILGDPSFQKMVELNRLLATGQADPDEVATWLRHHVPDVDEQARAVMGLPRLHALVRRNPDMFRRQGMHDLDNALFGRDGMFIQDLVRRFQVPEERIPQGSDLPETETRMYGSLGWWDRRMLDADMGEALARASVRHLLVDSPREQDGHKDAFQHALWSALMARRFGQDFARRYTSAHEATPRGSTTRRRAMDLHNNDVGLRIAAEHPNASPGELADLVQRALDRGELLVAGADNRLTWSNRVGFDETGRLTRPPDDQVILPGPGPRPTGRA